MARQVAHDDLGLLELAVPIRIDQRHELLSRGRRLGLKYENRPLIAKRDCQRLADRGSVRRHFHFDAARRAECP